MKSYAFSFLPAPLATPLQQPYLCLCLGLPLKFQYSPRFTLSPFLFSFYAVPLSLLSLPTPLTTLHRVSTQKSASPASTFFLMLQDLISSHLLDSPNSPSLNCPASNLITCPNLNSWADPHTRFLFTFPSHYPYCSILRLPFLLHSNSHKDQPIFPLPKYFSKNF